jgi:Zn-dependent protease with chaperone function
MHDIQGSGRLFGGSSGATGEDVRFSLAESLTVSGRDRIHTVPVGTLEIREVSNVALGLELSWNSGDTIYALQIFDAETLAAVRSHLGTLPQMQALQKRQRRAGIGRALGWTALIVFLLLPLLLILLFVWQADRIAAAAASRVPIEQEVRFGEQAFEGMRGSLQIVEEGPAYEAVRTLGERLTSGSKYRYRFLVAKDDTVNAFAVPGGIIVVHTGLIAATRRPEELAGVLAHEVQHVEQRHSLQAMIKNLGLRGLWALVSGDLGGGLIGRAAVELTSLSFSRAAEAQADEKGFDLLLDAGIDPRGMADFFAILGERDRSVSPPPFMSTHPASAAREAALRARLAAIEGRTFAPLELGPWPPTF